MNQIPDQTCVCCSDPAIGLFGPQNVPMCESCWNLGKLIEWRHTRKMHEGEDDACQDCDVLGFPNCNRCVGA